MNRQTDAGAATVSLLCVTFGVSRAAYYEALKPAPERAGDVVKVPRSPRYTAAEVVLAKVREVVGREGSEAWGVRKVWATLRREGLRVSRKRVWALMNAHGLVMARDREPGETTRGHVAVPEPNRRLATDPTTTWTRRDGVVAIVPTIDCGCRSMLGMVVTKDQHGPAVLESVQQALRVAFGSPAQVPDGVELRTDHGPAVHRRRLRPARRGVGHRPYLRAPRRTPRRATRSPSGSSARSRRKSSGCATGRASTSCARPSWRG